MAVIWHLKDNTWQSLPLDPNTQNGFRIVDGIFTRVDPNQAWLHQGLVRLSVLAVPGDRCW